MQKKIKYGKILVVLFITALIWVRTDLALDEELSVSNATISIAQSFGSNIWTSFDGEETVGIENIVLKGSASKIAETRRQIGAGSLKLDFILDPQKYIEANLHPIQLLDVLRKNTQIKKLGLSIESCSPQTITLNVIRLAEKSLNVKCFDEKGTKLKIENIEPASITMPVPEKWRKNQLIAHVLLNSSEEQQARQFAITKIPYIKLGKQIVNAPVNVKIKLLPMEKKLEDHTITSANIVYVLSPNLMGRFKIDLRNEPELSVIKIKATPAAQNAYEQQDFKMLLYIFDDDEKKKEDIRRKVVYNFPEEFVRKNEIRLNGPEVDARFKLVPLAASEALAPK